MTERELQIGIFGTFDVENYGDLLFPLIAEAELSRRLGRIRLRPFSYHKRTPPDWPYSVTSLTELPRTVDLDGIIIGGGHIIRFDKDVAHGYGPPNAAIHHPTGYWLVPALIGLHYGIPVVWNAPGVHGEIPAWADPLMKLAFTLSHYVSVRDGQAREALRRFAGGSEIAVMPDTGLGVARLLNVGTPSPDFTRLRRDVNLTDPYIVVQANSFLRSFPHFLRNHPHLFGNYRLVLLPLGPVHRDSHTIFDDNIPGVVRLSTWPHPRLMAELIANAVAAVGLSLHLSITALAFGVPMFRPSAYHGEKYETLADFGTVYRFDGDARADPEWFAARLGRTDTLPAVRVAVSQLDDHWDRIAAVFSGISESKVLARNFVVGEFWQSLPGVLEASEETSGQIAALHHSASWRVTAPLRFLRRRLPQWQGSEGNR